MFEEILVLCSCEDKSLTAEVGAGDWAGSGLATVVATLPPYPIYISLPSSREQEMAEQRHLRKESVSRKKSKASGQGSIRLGIFSTS